MGEAAKGGAASSWGKRVAAIFGGLFEYLKPSKQKQHVEIPRGRDVWFVLMRVGSFCSIQCFIQNYRDSPKKTRKTQVRRVVRKKKYFYFEFESMKIENTNLLSIS